MSESPPPPSDSSSESGRSERLDGQRLDDQRLDDLARRHVPALQAFIRLRMGDALAAREASADIVQSVFRELVGDRESFRYTGDDAFRAWLFTAAVHKILQKARYHGADRRSAKNEQITPNDVSTELEPDALVRALTPSRDAAAREELARVEACFRQLRGDDREIILLSRIAGLDHATIASRLGIREDASRARLRRALVRLSSLLHRPEKGRKPRPDPES